MRRLRLPGYRRSVWLSDLAGRLFPTSDRSVEHNVYVKLGEQPDQAEPDPEQHRQAWRRARRSAVRAFIDAESAHAYGQAVEPPTWPFGASRRLL